MDSDLLSAFLLGACAMGAGAGVAWQLLRRRPTAARRVERIGARRPSSDAGKRPAAPPPKLPTVGMLRPDMLAFSTISADPSSAEFFVQRAFAADLPYYREIPCEEHEKRELAPLFAHLPALGCRVNDEYSRDTYAVSFSPLVESALSGGYEPHVSATANDLTVIALRRGIELGEPMTVPDHAWGGSQAVEHLWDLFTPSGLQHELEGELREELKTIEAGLPRLKLLIPAVRGLEWQRHWDELFDLSRDVRRLGSESGRSQERFERADRLAESMRAANRRIDAAIKNFASTVKTAEEADVALTESIGLMDEREMSILFLRAIAIVRVIGSDDYMRGMRCSSRIAKNVEEFPDVHELLDRARRLALDALETRSRGMSEAEMQAAAEVLKDADRLAQEHDEALARLKKDVVRLQEVIDRRLILQGRRRRYAVRLKPDGAIDAFLVLEH